VRIETPQAVSIQAVTEGRSQRLIQPAVGGAAGGDVLDMGNLVIVAGKGADMIKESLDFHNDPYTKSLSNSPFTKGRG
jgi:hypothetical protein